MRKAQSLLIMMEALGMFDSPVTNTVEVKPIKTDPANVPLLPKPKMLKDTGINGYQKKQRKHKSNTAKHHYKKRYSCTKG